MSLAKDITTLSQRLRTAVTKVLLDGVDDSTELQTVKIVSGDEVHEAVERLQNYGFSSVPPAESEAIAIEAGGAHDNLVVVGTDASGYRPVGGLDGEVRLYSMHGQQIIFAQDGSVAVSAAPGARVTIPGDLTVVGNIVCSGITCSGLITALNVIAGAAAATVSLITHVHSALNAPPTPGT